MNKTISQPKKIQSDWVISQTLSDEQIKEQQANILSTPTMVYNPSGDVSSPRPLYAENQMLQMYRDGYMAMCRTGLGKRIITKFKFKDYTPYKVMRKMEVGDVAVFPFEKWNSVRSAASRICKDFDASFSVTKLGRKAEAGNIEVKRIA